MAKPKSRKIILAALIGNSLIAVMKFIVALVSGSASMLAEGFHSVADSGNQCMLLIGYRRAKRPPDEMHPFGYGQEMYFWAFAVAVSIFVVGGGLSIHEGIKKALHPEPVRSLFLPLAVLLLSALLEAYPWWVAFSEARKTKKGKGLMSYVDMAVRCKNPTVMVVLFEDTAALIGLVTAAVGVTVAYTTGNPLFDAAGSIVIGLILVGLAVFLARETKELLIGESASQADRAKIREVLDGIPEIKRFGPLLTMHLGADDILVNLDVEFADRLTTDELEAVVDRVESRIKEAVPAVKKIYIEAEAVRTRLTRGARPPQ